TVARLKPSPHVHFETRSNSSRLSNPLPVAAELLRGTRGKRLRRQRRIRRAARARPRPADDPALWRLAGEPEPTPDAGLRAVAHARAAVRMRRDPHRTANRRAGDPDRAGLAVPLLHLVLGERGDLPLVLLELRRDPAHLEAERILHLGIEIEEVVLVGQRRLLDVGAVGAVGILLD